MSTCKQEFHFVEKRILLFPEIIHVRRSEAARGSRCSQHKLTVPVRKKEASHQVSRRVTSQGHKPQQAPNPPRGHEVRLSAKKQKSPPTRSFLPSQPPNKEV